MGEMNSYFGRGESDLLYAKAGMQVGNATGDYTGVASLCAQASEKFLKAIIEKGFEPDTEVILLLKTHNQRNLHKQVQTKYKLTVSVKDCKWLGDYYFDARYPGENFTEVNKEEALECLEIVETIKEDTSQILETLVKDMGQKRKGLCHLKAFK